MVSGRVRSGVGLAFRVDGGGRGGGALGALAGTATDGDVTKGAAFSPVTTAVFAEMAGLRQVVVVVVTEFSVGRVTARAF